jgi:hypothetical protein
VPAADTRAAAAGGRTARACTGKGSVAGGLPRGAGRNTSTIRVSCSTAAFMSPAGALAPFIAASGTRQRRYLRFVCGLFFAS